MLYVRERPPIRLAVNIQTPDGTYARWGADDPNPRNQPQSLQFSTSMPGGFASWSCTLQRDPRLSYADLEELSLVTISGVGGQTAWQGRLEQLPDTGGAQAQVSPAGSGWQNHLQDDSSAAMIYIDQNLSSWQGAPLARQINLAQNNLQSGSQSVGADPATNDPALILEIDDSWASPYKPLADAWYDSGLASPIATVWYSFEPGAQINLSDSNWEEQVGLAADPTPSTLELTSNLLSAGTSGYFTPATPYRYAFVQHLYGATSAGASGAAYQTFWRLAVYGNHGLTPQGAAPGGLLASQVAAHALQTWAPKIGFTTGTNGTIQPSSFVIPQLAFLTPTTASAIIQQIVQYELLDWAVWEGPTFWMNPMGESAKTRNWRSRVGECQLQETGPDITRIFNGVVVQFTNVDGTAGTVGPPGSGAQATSSTLVSTDPENPANQAGINRWALVNMGTTTPAAAIQVGQTYLEAQAQLSTSGQASLVGHVQDDHGVWWPAWAVRAGDYLTVTDAADTSPRRIVSTTYDDSSKTNSVQLDQPPDQSTAVIQELSASIQSMGLS